MQHAVPTSAHVVVVVAVTVAVRLVLRHNPSPDTMLPFLVRLKIEWGHISGRRI